MYLYTRNSTGCVQLMQRDAEAVSIGQLRTCVRCFRVETEEGELGVGGVNSPN